MSYRKLSFYMMMMGIGALGLFNSSKLEVRYETNSNLELLCQNGMIISSVVILYFLLSFFVEIIVMRDDKRAHRQSKRYSTKYPIKHVSWKRDDKETVLPSEGSEVDDSLLKEGTLYYKTDDGRGPLQEVTGNQQEEE
jgi:hypothetical protein